MPVARLHDGSELDVVVNGDGPLLLLPVNPVPAEDSSADEMRRWGADPALGRTLIEGLEDMATVVAFDYEGHLLRSPKPDTLTPVNVCSDLLAIADALEGDTFAYYGYSWLALIGLQLAIRTDRISGLAMGGFPPLDGPYAAMLEVTAATHRMASQTTPTSPNRDRPPEPGDWSTVEVTMKETQARQFLTLYQNLQSFDDREALARISCPRLCFAGSEDEIEYDERWGRTKVSIAGPLRDHRDELENHGWTVHLLEGRDHMGAMQADQVLPILRPWLKDIFSGSSTS